MARRFHNYMTVKGDFLRSEKNFRNYDSITLEWIPGDPEMVRAIHAEYRGPDSQLYSIDDEELELLNAWNDFVCYAVEREQEQREYEADMEQQKRDYYNDRIHGLQ